jgi:hypothetical protein
LLEIVLWILVVVAGLLLLDRLFLWMEENGWVYWRKVKRKGSAGDVLTGFGFTDPGTKYLEEARQGTVQEDEDDGDDESKRKAEDRLT